MQSKFGLEWMESKGRKGEWYPMFMRCSRQRAESKGSKHRTKAMCRISHGDRKGGRKGVSQKGVRGEDLEGDGNLWWRRDGRHG